jgi:hypothetical protein
MGIYIITNKMKHYLTVAFITVLGTAHAQEMQDSTLLKMNKVELSKVYITEVQRVVKALPMHSLHDVQGTVPTTKYTQGKLKRVDKKAASYNQSLYNEMLEVIPYSDKQDLIKSILYLKTL